MSNLVRNILTIATALVLSVCASAAVAYHYNSHSAPQASGTTFNVVEGIPYTVSQTILPTDTTIVLSSFNSPSGLPLTMANFGSLGYATLDPTNLSRLETVTFTGISPNGNGTVTLTGVTRGIDFVSPYAASSTLARIHLVGSSLILSNPAAFYGQQFAFVNATTTIQSNWFFGSTTPPQYDFNPNFSILASTTLVSKGYVDSSVVSGGVPANNSTPGISIIATAAQAAASVATQVFNAVSYNLVLPSSLATSTPTAACTTGCIPVAVNGKISQLFLDLTQVYSVSGLWNFNAGFIDNASSTYTVSPILSTIKSALLKTSSTGQIVAATPGIDYIAGQYATSTTVSISASGSGPSSAGYATSTAITIPAGLLTASSTIEIKGFMGNCTISSYFSGSPGCNVYLSLSTGQQIVQLANESGGNNVTSPGSAFFTTVYDNGSVNSQIFNTIGVCAAGEPSNASCSYFSGGTSAINFANAVTLDIVLQVGPGGQGLVSGGVSGYSIVIRP